VIILPKPGRNPKLAQNLRPISLLPTAGKLFEKVILRIIQRHTEENNIVNPCQFGFQACHSLMLHCTRLSEHVTLNFSNNMSMAAVFLDIKKVFDTTWHPGWLYKLSELHFSSSLIKLISSFLFNRKHRVWLRADYPPHPNIQTGVLQGSILSPTLYSLYINDIPQTQGVYLSLFADHICLYSTDCKEGLCS
jgi:hypothetical protein